MFFAILILWLVVLILTSFGIRCLWSRFSPSRLFSLLLAPGLLVHEMSHVLACLLTGATVKEVSLRADGGAGRVVHTKPAIPVLGQALVSLAPLFGCGVVLWFVTRWLVPSVLAAFPEGVRFSGFPRPYPSLSGFGGILKGVWRGVLAVDPADWRTYLFLYLAVVLVAYISPSRRDLRSGLAALVVMAVGLLIAGWMLPGAMVELIRIFCPFLTFCVVLALSVLLVTLLVMGLVRLGRLLLRGG